MYRQGMMAASGDYYRGDYYRGDGLFGSLFGGLKKIAGTALAMTPAGRIAQAAGSLILRHPAAAARAARTFLPGGEAVARSFTNTAYASPIGASLPPPPAFTGRPMGRGGPVVVVPRRGSFEPTEVLTPGHGLPRRRRMNVTNPKALRRAIRRAKGFEKLAMRTIRLINPQRKGRFGGFKKTTRRK